MNQVKTDAGWTLRAGWKMKQMKSIQKGEYLMRLSTVGRIDLTDEPDIKESMVWVKGDYIRSEQKYSITRFDDMNRETLIKGNALVWVGFTF